MVTHRAASAAAARGHLLSEHHDAFRRGGLRNVNDMQGSLENLSGFARQFARFLLGSFHRIEDPRQRCCLRSFSSFVTIRHTD